jgi:RNase H-fold protein (predicted Holliday junction resolvase)
MYLQVGSIGANYDRTGKIGVATESGKAYYRIVSLLHRTGFRYFDVLPPFREIPPKDAPSSSPRAESSPKSNWPPFEKRSFRSVYQCDLVLTTRREKLSLDHPNVVCIEDLGDDPGLAREKLLSLLYPSTPEGDKLVVGIDPGERIGVAAFINEREIDSRVFRSVDDTVANVSKLLKNAPEPSTKVVRIGRGSATVGEGIARGLESQFDEGAVKIEIVDEKGTSSLSLRQGRKFHGKIERKRKLIRALSRDERAAQLIAFRQGAEYNSASHAERR